MPVTHCLGEVGKRCIILSEGNSRCRIVDYFAGPERHLCSQLVRVMRTAVWVDVRSVGPDFGPTAIASIVIGTAVLTVVGVAG